MLFLRVSEKLTPHISVPALDFSSVLYILIPEKKKRGGRKPEFLLDLEAEKPRKSKTVWSAEHWSS